MRMQIKQQFWRSCGDNQEMRKILLEQFTSIIHLSRALLFLMGKTVPQNFESILQMTKSELGLSMIFLDPMLALKKKPKKLSNTEAVDLFTGLMEVIRLIDNKTDQVKI
jgi:hypothetical protein